MSTKHIELQVSGMTCSNCALSIEKFLKKEGLTGTRVDFASGEVAFDLEEEEGLEEIVSGINQLGFTVSQEREEKGGKSWTRLEKLLAVSAVFTLPLLLHMFLPWHALHNPWIQLILCLPVYIIGILHFGKSAWGSLRGGVANMDVLIFLGATAAFGYSLYGTLTGRGPDFLFYETAASIITLVLLGNLIEHRAVQKTNSSIRALAGLEAPFARLLDEKTQSLSEVPLDQVQVGDLLLLHSGDRVPVDGNIHYGETEVDESMLTGESLSVWKKIGDEVASGTLVVGKNVLIRTIRAEKESSLAQIIQLVKQAQTQKPLIQRLADRISGVFVPTVLAISLLTFLLSYFVFGISMQASLIHSIAVLVISCPCAMGLATPTAVTVGIGKASKRGILVKGGRTLEQFTKAERIVFDKTGTLTDGKFQMKEVLLIRGDREEIHTYLKGLAGYSSHPISQSIRDNLADTISFKFKQVEEVKGKGLQGIDEMGNTFRLGSPQWVAEGVEIRDGFNIWLSKNQEILAKVKMEDHILPDAGSTIEFFKKKGVVPILLSGDTQERCERVGKELGIEEIYGSHSPEQKLTKITQLSEKFTTIMVGDGINDAPALTQAHIGVSMGAATDVARNSADIILMKGGLGSLREFYIISRQTLQTIKQNLFWAFFYNVCAIPLAAIGLLSPIIGAMAMALSDVLVIGNSLRLRIKKILPEPIG